jgi:4-aminobutyrate aminotransferase-like enzyme
VVDAVMRQISTPNTHTRYLHRGIIDYSERLLNTMPNGINQVMYACSGSEVNDLALRVAEIFTDAGGVIVTRDAHHGNRDRDGDLAVSRGCEDARPARAHDESPTRCVSGTS